MIDDFQEPGSIEDRTSTDCQLESAYDPVIFDWAPTTFLGETQPECATDPFQEVLKIPVENFTINDTQSMIPQDIVLENREEKNVNLIIERPRRLFKKKERLPSKSKKILLDWIRFHRKKPYPTSDEMYELAIKSDLTTKQVRTFLCNYRIRYLRNDDDDTFYDTKKLVPIKISGSNETIIIAKK